MSNTEYYKTVSVRKEDWKTLKKFQNQKNRPITWVIKYALIAYEQKETLNTNMLEKHISHQSNV